MNIKKIDFTLHDYLKCLIATKLWNTSVNNLDRKVKNLRCSILYIYSKFTYLGENKHQI